ncbi:MAG: fructose-1,6-bisphosphatase [Candidatus Nanosalina sp. J07AB43]|nr:MAG: fructose-1,6-bisphosphatase [Candidatus Nanosalina sp. J07AB43]
MDKEKVIDSIIEDVAKSAPEIRSGMESRRDYSGDSNPSDEEELEADIWANQFLKDKITSIDGVGQYASEEEQEVTDCGQGLSVAIDPLDGSSNIPTNNMVGTIVGIYSEELPCKGVHLEAAFYVLYGPLTTVAVARDGTVNEYVLSNRELHLSHEEISIEDKNIYGFGGNKDWFQDFREMEHEISKKYKLRYGGSLVGDFNQMLHHGGVFGYPAKKGYENGKYRILFEGNPMAYITEAAGGKATTGEQRILEVDVDEVHQRVPFIVGHEEMVNEVSQTTSKSD